MLGQYLKKYRLSKNMTQSKMAMMLGTSQAYYCLIETGAKKPGMGMIDRIASAIGQDAAFVRSLL